MQKDVVSCSYQALQKVRIRRFYGKVRTTTDRVIVKVQRLTVTSRLFTSPHQDTQYSGRVFGFVSFVSLTHFAGMPVAVQKVLLHIRRRDHIV